MAQLISVKLSRFDGSPWGFRLQGGKDFGTPLIVQKVNNGSPAEAAGLRAGDAVIKVNNTDMFSLRHKDAQDVIVRAGNNFEMTVQRGGSTWRPSVSPVTASIPSPQPTASVGSISPVTKTSLAAKKQDVHHIGSGHNFSPKPFLNGTSDGTVKSIVNKQYNSPVGIYSEETIAETLSAQAEVLAGGVLGVNFKKNEKNYNAQNSEVFKMVQEADKEPRTPEPAEPAPHSGVVTPTSPALASLRPVQAPETKPQPSGGPPASLPPGQNICAECERLIVGVFVRIKDKNLHVECFKCSTCGTSLKNVGYYNINGKLYCDIHAKLVARQNAPAGLVPVTAPPGQKAPTNTISAALSNIAPLSPSLSNHGSSSPQPFSTCARASPESRQCQYRNGYNGNSHHIERIEQPINGMINGTTDTNNYTESKTYTSTLTIQTSNNTADYNNGYESLQQQQQKQQQYYKQSELDYNRNPTNDYLNNVDNKLHKLTDDIRDFAIDQHDYCAKTVHTPTAVRAFKPSRLGSASLEQPSFRPVQAPTSNSISGPKPFIGSSVSNQNYSPSPIINTGSSSTLLSRPQSQSVTGQFSTLPKPKSSPFKETRSYHEECCDKRQSGPKPQTFHEEYCTYEVIQEVCRPKAAEKPPTPKAKSTWPPVKAIEDITYPTASPLYIDPNPTLDRRTRQVTRERRATVESVISREHSRRNSFVEQQQYDREMEQISCPGPVYRRVELVNARESRQSRCERSSSRASSTESVRRSLTPTRITQPIPRPWTATVTTGTNLYQSAYAPQPDQICRKFCEKEVCQREKVCQREQSSEREVCQKFYKRESSCERQPPPGYHYQEQHMHREEDTCKTEGNIRRHEHITSQACKFTCEPDPEPESEIEPQLQVQQEERVDLSKLVPPDVAICPKGIDAEHDLYTETEEEDKGNLHIKKITTYEKTIELVSPDREMGSPFGQQQEKAEVTLEEYTQRSSTVDREVEDISGRRHVSETSETLTKKIDTQQMIEEARKQEEEERRRREEEERNQREEEERKRQEEERLIAEMRKREEEQRRQKEEAEKKRKEEERRRLDEEEAERARVCCSEQRTEIEEYYHPRERIIDIQVEEPSCKCSKERIIDVQIEDERPPSRERIIEIKLEEDPPCRSEVKEIKEEINIKQHCEHRDYEEQRKRSLREQVEVHQSLRDQERRQPSLQERRLCSRLSQQSKGQQQQLTTSSKKHVQFVKQTESGPCPLPQTPVKNSTPKEWKSEMCKALTTASDRPYSPLQVGTGNQGSSYGGRKEVYRKETTYEESTICHKCQAKLLPESTRPISPFVEALTTASDRPYSPLGREVDTQSICRCKCRSQTPEMKNTYEGYSAPSQILYRGKPKEPPKKPEGPRPLPTPPPDFRFRNRSVSPCRSRSRSQTPSGRVSACGLKKPDTIPSYQKYLVCEEQAPVQSQDFPPSRTPTPGYCTGSSEPPTCCRAQAPRIKDDTPPCKRDSTTPDKSETIRYHYEEDTPHGHKTKDTVSSKTVSWVGQGVSKHAHFQEHDDILTEECDGSHHVKKIEHRLKEYDEPEQPPAEQSVEATCYISRNSRTQPTLRCPASQSDVMDRIQKTGVRVFAPMGTPEVRRIRHEIPPPSSKPPCPMTGVTVLPVKAHSETSCKTGVVVVPCDGIGSGGVCITPTPDRSGVCVSPCPAQSGGICQKPSCYCGSTSGTCTTSLGNEKTTCSIDAETCTGTGICVKSSADGSCTVGPCTMTGIPGVRSVQCPKPVPKCLGAAKACLPFPQIPLPDEEPDQSPCQGCPRAPTCTSSTTTCFSSTSESRDCGFQPIHKPQPRTNLSNQITTLTLCKREKTTASPAPKIPTVQLYKPQSQPVPPPPCKSSTQVETIQSQKRFRREIQTTCQSQNRTQTQTCSLTSKTQKSVDPPNLSSHPDLGASGFGGSKGGTFAGSSAPNRGRGILNQAGSGLRIPLCAACNSQVRGPFISALGQIWCPEHFVCVNPQCRRGLQDIGFVEEKGQLYCEYCFERFIAPSCNKCNNKIKGDCLNAIGKHFHPECFTCAHCGKQFGNSPFFLEEGLAYCERDWNDLFTTKCFACGFPVEVGDRWVEALNNNYHSQCFNCTMCKKNLEGQNFYAKGGRPFCKNHAR